MRGLIGMALIAIGACSSASEPHAADTTGATPGGCLCEVTLSPTSAALSIGSTLQIVATSPGRVSMVFTWTSSDTTIASVVQTGGTGTVAVVTARKPGVVAIKATASADPSQSAAAVIIVSNPSPSGVPTVSIASINEVTGGVPANLAAANCALAVAFSANWLDDSKANSAELLIHRAAGDTVVATVAVPNTLASAGKWTDTLIWNTSARLANGAALFANGSYTVSVRAVFDKMTTQSTPHTVYVSNP